MWDTQVKEKPMKNYLLNFSNNIFKLTKDIDNWSFPMSHLLLCYNPPPYDMQIKQVGSLKKFCLILQAFYHCKYIALKV